jgi:hypothetical protein
MINYGVVYPQAILMFVITMLYSVVQPLIVIFGAIYFGVAYVVYKYKLLFGALVTFCSYRRFNLIFLKSFINHTNPKDKHGQSHSYASFGESSYSSSLWLAFSPSGNHTFSPPYLFLSWLALLFGLGMLTNRLNHWASMLVWVRCLRFRGERKRLMYINWELVIL